MNENFWKNKRVLITGHTGFKGSWLTIWLNKLGADVTGFSKNIPTQPSLFVETGIENHINHIFGDIVNYDELEKTINSVQPDVIFHLAAQSLVRYSYTNPRETYETNVLGTVNLLDAVRLNSSVKITVVVTSDKCYENKEWEFGYREVDEIGGHDPYSNSKGAAELVVSAYNKSFFNTTDQIVTTARAGNVIGGGDWAIDRLVPDIFLALQKGNKVKLRNPNSIRPWQHVLEPLSGYLLLAEKAYNNETIVRGSWNFGPNEDDAKSVEWITEQIGRATANKVVWEYDRGDHPHEANYLKLDISRVKSILKWHPRWTAEKAVEMTAKWYQHFYASGKIDKQSVLNRCLEDINDYLNYANNE